MAQKFLHEQMKESYCCQNSSTQGLSGPTFNYDKNWSSIPMTSISGTVQKVFPTAHRARQLYHLHYKAFAGHSGEGHMYG